MEPIDWWERLRTELRDTRIWYGDDPEVSAFVGIDSQGAYFGGVHVEGEALDSVDVEFHGNADAEDVVIEIIRQLKAYRKRTDEERADG